MVLFAFKLSNIKHVPYSELSMPKKGPAPTVKKRMSNAMALRRIINNVFNAGDALSDLFGNVRMLKNATGFPGSVFGSRKATQSEDSQSFPDTARSKSNKLKIIGSIIPQNLMPFSLKSNMPFMTALTSGKTTALLSS
jgi:hypothetical protein